MGENIGDFSAREQQILSLIESGELDRLDDAWLEVVSDPPTDAKFYDKFIRAMRRAHALERAHELLLLALEELKTRQQWELLHAVVRIAARFWPDSKPLRPYAAAALKGVYAHLPQLSAMIAACKGLPLDQVFQRFDSLLQLLPGEVYSHAYWGEGIVTDLDLSAGKITLDFPEEKGRVIAIEFLRKHLTYCPPDSFLARRRKNPQELYELGQGAPSELVKLVLRGNQGRIKQAELKEALVGSVIPEEEWNEWWSRARNELRIDPWIDFDVRRGAHAEIVLRSAPRSAVDEIAERFFAHDATMADRISAVRKLREVVRAGATPDAELVGRMREALLPYLADRSDVARALEACYLLQDLQSIAPNQLPDLPCDAAALCAKIEDYELLLEMEDDEYAARALQELAQRDGDKVFERAGERLPRARPALAQAIWTLLDPEHHVDIAVRALRTLMENPLSNPETYLWAMRNLTEGKWEHLEDYLPLSSLIFELFDQMEQWHRLVTIGGGSEEEVAAAKWLIGKVRTLISGRNFALLAAVAKEMPLDQLQELRRIIQLHNAVNDVFRNGADRALRLTRRELEEQTQQTATVVDPDSGIHYCTKKGHAWAVRELHELNTVRIPANAREIEKARSEGDLRENAGYHGAREKHVLLLQQAHFLQLGLATARVVTRDKVNTEQIGFGTRVIVQDVDSGAEQVYTLLGQWEAKPEEGIYFYKAPLFQQFLGKRVGDEFTVRLPDGTERRYRVTSIENALANGEWDVGEGVIAEHAASE
ncbi:MAG: GreA/GreB family elongation factor [Candidatus Sumerlaea chitinivorans]|nr:GreA/GreB family elongation factor [Candidatus Sumerlaea chitinivorans]